MRNKLTNKILLSLVILAFLFINIRPVGSVLADATTSVSVGAINYEELTMQVYSNNNSTIYYSLDEDNWTELEGAYNSSTKSYLMDISWVPITSEFTLYFKGDINTNVLTITLPPQDTSLIVTYDKTDGSFHFTNADDADYFEWRKTTDYNWYKVSLQESSPSYKDFLKTMGLLCTKGAKVVFRIPQVTGLAMNEGSRSSKEVPITIAARAEGPLITVNSSKLTINTSTAMEYYDTSSSTWLECSKAMALENIVPKTLYANGAKDTSVMIRVAATEKVSYSKTTSITIKGQRSAPEIGDNSKDVSYYYLNSKLTIGFNKASTTNVYEYTIVKLNANFDLYTAKWTSVSNAKLMTFVSTKAPKGCTIYIRKKGIDANSGKNIDLVLSSAISSFRVDY